MPAPRLPREQILQWLADGHTQREVVDLLAQRRIPATQTAISRIKVTYGDRRGIRPGHMRTKYIPWDLAFEHRSLYAAKMLRALDRRDRGEALPDQLEGQLDRWLAALDEDNASIHYDAETDQGFWRVPRRPGERYIRYPDPEVDPN